MKVIYSIIILLFWSFISYGQESFKSIKWEIAPSEKNSFFKAGDYIYRKVSDRDYMKYDTLLNVQKFGKITTFESPFLTGMVSKYVGNSIGVIDSNGKWEIPAKYHYLTAATRNTIVASLKTKNGVKKGIINRNNEIILPIEYDQIHIGDETIESHNLRYILEDNLAIVENENDGYSKLINFSGEELISHIKYRGFRMSFQKLGSYIVVNNLTFLSDGRKMDNYHIYDLVKKTMLSEKYSTIIKFENSLFAYNEQDKGMTIMDSLMNKKNNYFINEYTKLVMADNKWILAYKDKPISADKYEYIVPISDDRNLFKIIDIKSNRSTIINQKGELVVAGDKVDYYSDRKLFIVKKDNKYGVVDIYGKVILEYVYDNVKLWDIPNIITASVGKLNYALTVDGKLITTELNNMFEPTDGYNYLIVSKNQKIGLITLEGKQIIPSDFDEIVGFSDNYIRVKKNNKYGFVDKNGVIVTPIVYDQLSTNLSSGRGLSNTALCGDLCSFEKGDQKGFIDLKKNRIVKSYSDVESIRILAGTNYAVVSSLTKGRGLMRIPFN